jgi:restriction endonuclease S subunit
MRSEWQEATLGEIVNFRRGHDLTRKNMNPEGRYPVVGSNGVIGFHDSYTLKGPLLTIGRSGNVGTPYFLEGAGWAHNTTLYVDDFKENEPRFIYYFLQTIPFAQYGGGSAVPTLNRNHIHPLKVIYPKKVSIQKAIAATLSCLDAKIEVNNKIIKNLEQQAQAIFKSWFVDFEPFQDGEFVESELGLIPKGWKLLRFGDFIASRNEYGNNPKVPTYSVTNTGLHLRRDIFKRRLSSSETKNKVLYKGDLVFGMSRNILNWGIMKDRIGEVSSAYQVYEINQKVINSD